MRLSHSQFGIFIAGSAMIISGPAFAQFSGGIPPQVSIWHELGLVLAGAIFGGLFGPALQAFDAWIGMTPGVRQQRDNYKVQREIAASLAKLVAMQQLPPSSPPPASN